MTDHVPHPYMQPIPMRMLGENLSLTYAQLTELLDSLKPESELADRIRSRLLDTRAESIREATGCSWESACARAELERDLSTTTPQSR